MKRAKIGMLIPVLLGWSTVLLGQFNWGATTATIGDGNYSYVDALTLGQYHPTGDCPPRLTKKSPQATFLDSIGIPDSMTNALFDQYSQAQCQYLIHAFFSYQQESALIDSVFASYQLPVTFRYLPLPLSQGNPNLSYAIDHKGLWQLDFVNARKNGLLITPYVDERFHVELSTIAAAKHLQFLQQHYLNNPSLVILAYFTSVPEVNRLLKSHPQMADDNLFAYLGPREQYLFAAYKSWVEYVQLFKLDTYPTPNWVTTVSFPDTITFEALASFLTVSKAQLHQLNAVWTNATYYPNHPYGLVIPSSQASTIEAQYAAFISHQKELAIRQAQAQEELQQKMALGIPDLDQYSPVTYTVKSGDVLGKIAQKHHVKVSQIKQWNNLHSDRINVGQELTIYQLKNAVESIEEPTPPAPPKTANPGNGTPEIYIVKSGDSLWLIAKKYPGVSAENIMEWNGISDKIDVGQKLKIYTP